MLITKKRIVLAVGIGCIFWSYYQLFVVSSEDLLVNKQITALTERGEIKGKVVDVTDNFVILLENEKITRVPQYSVIRVDDLVVDEYETKRVLNTVFISIFGGIVIWIALFFL